MGGINERRRRAKKEIKKEEEFSATRESSGSPMPNLEEVQKQESLPHEATKLYLEPTPAEAKEMKKEMRHKRCMTRSPAWGLVGTTSASGNWQINGLLSAQLPFLAVIVIPGLKRDFFFAVIYEHAPVESSSRSI